MSSRIPPEWRKTTLEDLEEARRQAGYLRERFGPRAGEACSMAMKAARDSTVRFKLHLVMRELRRSAAREAMAREAEIALRESHS